MKINIIIAHYLENLEWVKNINPAYNIYIYSKTNKNFNFVDKNQGQEAPMYLKYIIDNYDKLADRNLFLHAHRYSYHQTHHSDFIANNLNWNLNDYFSVNKRENCYFDEGLNETNYGADNYIWIKDNWRDIFPEDFVLPKIFHHYCSAQFQVTKELILRHSIDFYKKAFDWIQNTDLSNYQSSRIFEHLWHYIFTGNNIEPKINDYLIQY